MCAVAAATLVIASEAFAADVLNLMWGATSASSGYYPMNVALAAAVNKYCPHIHITVVETGGTGDNFKGMERGNFQFGQAADGNIQMAQTGTGVYKNHLMKEPRMLVVTNPQVYSIVVTEESGVKTLSDLEGKKFCPGLKGSIAEILLYTAMKAFGYKPDFVPGNTGEAVDGMKDRRIVGFCKSHPITTPDSAILDVATARKIRLVGYNEEEQKKFVKALPIYSIFSVSGSVYGLEGEYKFPGEHFGMSVSASLPEDVVYDIFKAICEHQDEIAVTYAGIRGHDALQMTADSNCWLHPGVIKYLKEKGIEPRPDQIPPEYKAK